ncbi:hypothetical protein [Spongiactinospora sp. TRM90649]|uniref:hypothetical protein n=1 Tax=Spongiactinospora sp. TRM90649 TaxID=3031114 RepID=UPI0023F9231F|nr:hypothetical protein [Spongiactinospora sp. TRM90649]MDF5758370.1 hypothetical protein [Spongiactinospora sp. TRM90649]
MMRKAVRTWWIAIGAALTAVAVLGIAAAAWSGIRVPRGYDFSFPGSFESSVLDERMTETRTVTYAVTTPQIIVDVQGGATVRVAPGVAGRLTVKRETVWRGGAPSLHETWERGKTLRVEVTCPKEPWTADPACRTGYTLSVPPGVGVLVTTPDWSVSCPPATKEVTCGPKTGAAAQPSSAQFRRVSGPSVTVSS